MCLQMVLLKFLIDKSWYGKTKVLMIGVPQLLNKLPAVSVRMLGKEITPSTVAKDLGILY